MNQAREFIEFWVENSVHAQEEMGMRGAEQRVSELVRSLVTAAQRQGIGEAAMIDEVGDLTNYLTAKLSEVNQAEKYRKK